MARFRQHAFTASISADPRSSLFEAYSTSSMALLGRWTMQQRRTIFAMYERRHHRLLAALSGRLSPDHHKYIAIYAISYHMHTQQDFLQHT